MFPQIIQGLLITFLTSCENGLRTIDAGIEIVRIIHGSQDIEQMFKEVEDSENQDDS